MTLPELLVAAAITLLVVAGALGAARPAHETFEREQERADAQQRQRVAAEALAADLRQAVEIRPYRVGLVDDDPSAGVYYRPDVVAVLLPPDAGWPTSLGERRTYYLRPGVGMARYDGGLGDFPFIDGVESLRFEYSGDPQPPRLMAGDSRPRPTYGPPPPGVGEDDPADSWGPGENCTFRVDDGRHVPRLDTWPGTRLVALPAAVLTDGPWCPDAQHAARFDADLLRLRQVDIHLGLAATARLPSQVVHLTVSPRNRTR